MKSDAITHFLKKISKFNSRSLLLDLSCLGHIPFCILKRHILLCMNTHLVLNWTKYINVSIVCLLQTFKWSLCLFIIRKWKTKFLLTAAIATRWWNWQKLKCDDEKRERKNINKIYKGFWLHIIKLHERKKKIGEEKNLESNWNFNFPRHAITSQPTAPCTHSNK